MRNVLFLGKALVAFSALFSLSGPPLSAAVSIPATAKVAGPAAGIGGGLNAEYWLRPSNTIVTDGNTVPANRIDTQILGFGTPSGTFRAKSLVYLGNDLTPVASGANPWLGSDTASYSGVLGNLDDGAFRFRGYVNVLAPGTLRIGANTDDGSRISIAGLDIINNDGGHGDATVSENVDFAAAGLYPIEITYFNGDWTSDGNNHTGNPDPGAHGGANFRLLISDTNVTSATVGALFFDAIPDALPSHVNIGNNKVGSVTNNGGGSYTVVGGGNDIWDDRDEFTFANRQFTGDFDVQVRVESFSPNARWSKAGIMAREDLSEYSRDAFIRVAPADVPTSNGGNGANDTRFMYRKGTDNVSGVSDGQHEDIDPANPNPNPNYPNAWLRLVRTGSVLLSSNSLDGVTWNYVSSQDTASWPGGPMTNTLFVGLAASRHSGGPTATAEFRDFKITYAQPFALVGASSRGNPTGVRASFNGVVGAGAYDPANYTLTTLSGPNVTVVTGLRFTTANDSPARDPMTFTLEGRSSASAPWALIASGNTGLDVARFATAPDVSFANSTPYSSYRLLFPTVRDAAGANSMQIAEVEFLDAGGNDVTLPGDAVIPTSANSPGGEQSPLAIDNNTATKYLNFDKLNTGFIVTPTVGALPPSPTVLAAGPGLAADSVQLTTTPLVEGAVYELLVQNMLSEGGDAPFPATASLTHGEGYGAQTILVTHNKTQDSGYYRFSDAVRNGVGQGINLGGGNFPGYSENGYFEDPIPDTGSNERFGTRISGVIVPTISGNHTFAMSSDDVGFLYLSSDDSPANKVQIANEPNWNGGRQYTGGGNQGSRGNPPANISAPQNLVAGKKYYLELIFNEGGGGNNGSATWQVPGGPAIAGGQEPISNTVFTASRLVGGETFYLLGPVKITQQPTNLTVVALLPATLGVRADGTPGYTYQWRRNGNPIAGATSSTYTIPAAQLTDDQSVFSVVVANEFSSVVSANAILTVLSPVPPHLVSAAADTTFSRVTVNFDNRVDPVTAGATANYTLSGGVTVNSATRSASGLSVVLTTTTLAEDTTYTLTVSGIKDETTTTTLEPSPTNTTFTTLVFAPGYITKEKNKNFSGGAVDAYVAATRAGTTTLLFSCLTDIWEYNTFDDDDNYGGHLSGLFIPTTSGAHTFYISTDDPGRLFLSTDATPANAVLIASEPVWNGRRDWVGTARRATPPENISAPINLVAGQKYYIESFFTEGGGGDNMAVAVQGPTDPVPVSGSTPITSASVGTYIQAGVLSIVTQPQTVTRTENAVHTFSVVAQSTSPVAICGSSAVKYQWLSNGVPVAGATGATLTVGPITLADEGTVYSVVVTAPARSVTSANAILHVNVDNVPPVLASIKADSTLSSIILEWNEIMATGPVIEAGNYLLKNSLGVDISTTISGIIPNPNGSNVTLTLNTLLDPSTTYTLEVDYQTDVAGNGPTPFGSPVVDVDHGVVKSFTTFSLLSGYVRFEAYGGGNGTAVTVLTGLPNYPNSPDLVRYITALDSRLVYPGDGREQYGARMTGYFIPPADGDYTFYVRSDDASELWLSTDANPANLVKIAEETGCCAAFAAHPSASISLVGGQRYYIQMLYREGGGGDYGQVAVKLTSSAQDPNTLTPISGNLIASLFDTTGASVTITQQPTSQTFAGAIVPFSNDFNVNNGGFYMTMPAGQEYSGPWHYEIGTGSWREDGQGPETGHPNTSILNTPALIVRASGVVSLSFDHRYSREGGNWDGGQLRISVNGDAFSAVPLAAFTQNGYNGIVLGNSSSVLHGQDAFVNDSPGHGAGTFLTSIAQAPFTAGDVLRLQFLAGNDGNTAGSVPNWEINSIQSAELDAYPGLTTNTVTFSVGATGQNALGSNQPLTYQWSRDDGSGFVAIAGATSRTYTLAPAPSDNGARFRVTVTVAGASAVSSIAVLTVGSPATLQIGRSGAQTVVTWTSACSLQEAAVLTNDGSGWGPSAVVNGVPFTPTGSQRYFRLVCP